MSGALENYPDAAEYSDDGSHNGTADQDNGDGADDEQLMHDLIMRWTPGQVRKMIRDSIGKGKAFASQKAFAQAIRVGLPALSKFLGQGGSMAGKDSYIYEDAGKYFLREEAKNPKKAAAARKRLEARKAVAAAEGRVLLPPGYHADDEHLLQQIIMRWTPAQVRKKIRDSVGTGKPFASKKAFAQAIHVAPSSLALFLGKTGSMAGRDSSVFEGAGKYFIREEAKSPKKAAAARKRLAARKATAAAEGRVLLPRGYLACPYCHTIGAPKERHWCLGPRVQVPATANEPGRGANSYPQPTFTQCTHAVP